MLFLLNLPMSLAAQLDQITLRANELNALLPLKQDIKDKLDKKIRLDFNYNSNHIEGNTLTYGETELLIIFGKTTGNHDIREYEEMKAHDVAFQLIKEWAVDYETPLTEMAIKNLHKIILVSPFWKEAETADGQPTSRLLEIGNYKQYPNSVRLQNGEMFHYSSPQETPAQMGELVQWYRNEEQKAELHPVVLAAMFHYRFVRIHPFDDGNGCLSRLLMNYILLRHQLPPVIIPSAKKSDYLFALNQADIGDTEAFVTYIASQLIASLDLHIRAAKGEEIEEPDDWEKKLVVLKKRTLLPQNALPKDDRIIFNIIRGGIVPFANALRPILMNFADLFSSKSFHFSVPMLNGYREILLEDILINYFLEVTIEKLPLYCSFSGYNRDASNPFFINLTLEWHFDTFEYYLQINTDPTFRFSKLYSQTYTQQDIHYLVNLCGKYLMYEIEKRISKTEIL